MGPAREGHAGNAADDPAADKLCSFGHHPEAVLKAL